ncbi:MAG: hypothetical protein OEY00_13240 [Gammaproteobacteria bacterium]|nr:hypothetical protein [Gammaproteobacteria bacterium]
MKKIMMLLFFISSINVTFAGVATGEIAYLFLKDNNVNFKLKNDPCGAYGNYGFNTTNPSGKDWYAQILAAAHAGVPIEVHYLNPCENVSKPVSYLIQHFN